MKPRIVVKGTDFKFYHMSFILQNLHLIALMQVVNFEELIFTCSGNLLFRLTPPVGEAEL